LEYYLLGAKHCRHPACLHQALKLSDDRKPLLAWAKEHLPTARVRFRLTIEAIQEMFEGGRGADAAVTRSISETFSAYVQEERFIEGRSFLECLFDLGLWGSSAENQRVMSEFALRQRSLCPSLIATDFCHARLEQAFQELRQAVDTKCAEKGQPALTTSTEAIGTLIGKPDEYLAMTPEQLTRNEFCQIEEYGQLIKGVRGAVAIPAEPSRSGPGIRCSAPSGPTTRGSRRPTASSSFPTASPACPKSSAASVLPCGTCWRPTSTSG
jgi:hypothetical protein